MTDSKIDTKHFLMAIVAIVAIVAISFVAVMMTNNDIATTGGAYAGTGDLSSCLKKYGTTSDGVGTCLGFNFVEVPSEDCDVYQSLDGSIVVTTNC